MSEKYEYVKTQDPVFVQVGEKNKLSVECKASKRISDGLVFINVIVVSGYSSAYGFSPNKYNSRIQLPSGMTKDDWNELMKAYNQQSVVQG